MLSRKKEYKVYTYSFFDSSLGGAGDQVVVAGFQISPPFVNNKEVYFKSISFHVVAGDVTTGTNYAVTDVSYLELLQFDMASFTPLGSALPTNTLYMAGSQQQKQFLPGEFRLYGDAINIAVVTPSGSKGFVAAGNWFIQLFVTIEYWYGN